MNLSHNIIQLMFLLFILILLFNLYGFYRFENINRLDRYERRFVSYDTFDTGDVFLVTFENIGKVFVGSFYNIEFLHPALVVKEGNDTYVLELMGYKNKQGFQKMKLEEWVNRNKSHHIMINKLKTSDQNRKELSNKLLSFTYRYGEGSEKISHVGGFDFSWWWKYVNPTGNYKHPEIKNGKTPCNEFCTRILVESDIVKGDKPIGHYHPDQFIGMKGFSLNDGYEYNEYYLCDFSKFRF